jgi:hypothetical protein
MSRNNPLVRLTAARVAVALTIAGTPVTSGFAQPVLRTFRLGFSAFPTSDSESERNLAYMMVRDHGDLVSHSFQQGVPWPEALVSADYRSFPSGVINEWGMAAFRDATFVPNHSKYISIQPINFAYNGLADYWGASPSQPLGPPWDGVRFNDARVKTAFLNYAIAAVEFFHPQYLGIGVDVNILLARRPDLWSDY